MIKILFHGTAVVGVLLLTPAAAIGIAHAAAPATCAWHAAMEEDEGGSILTASVCQSTATGAPQLLLQCLDGPHLSYDLGDAGGDLEPDAKAVFSFKVGDKSIDKTLTLKAMDNNFTADFKRNDPLLSLLTSGAEVSVQSAKYRTNVFTLSGAKAAIAKVLAKCK